MHFLLLINKEELVLFDIELYKKVDDECRGFWTGGVDRKLIYKFSKKLNVNFPKSYIEFLNKFGEGGICGTYYLGIKREDYSSVYNKTIEFRKKYNINLKWVVIADESNEWEEYILCLDTSRMIDNECPVIKYDYVHQEEEDYKENFYDLFNYRYEVFINE